MLKLVFGLHRTARTAGHTHDVSLRIEEVNREPALVIRNPGKLAYIDRQLGQVH